MPALETFIDVLLSTIRDVLPIATILVFFQFAVLRRPLPQPRKLITGFVCVLFGLVLFLMGLEQALFPVGRLMAQQFTDPAFVGGTVADAVAWHRYGWVYAFAFAVGFSTTVAEPALIAVALKASELSNGAISSWGLRFAVAIGVAVGISLGVFRIVTGIPIQYFIISGYIVVVVQTLFAPKLIVPLAYDSGGVTTSTVTVPLVAALGLGMAENVPGRSALIDGFGLIAFASLFPIISVMAYAQLAEWRVKRKDQSAVPADTRIKERAVS
ncbi:MAG: DUF1538 domain-containing protein [Gammaproteobacteria bacterium]|nr:DUF1538 domain-containing protein [Gammaproteobacteria bacterium]